MRPEIMRIKWMFMFLVTAWFKNWMVIYWVGKLLLVKLVKVHSFLGAKISCMTDHVKPTLQDINLNHIVLHAGTDDLRTEYTAHQIAKATMDLVTSLKNDDNTLTVSGIVPRLDNSNSNTNEMNLCLVLMCKERNISFFSLNESIDPTKQAVEWDKLHLSNNGSNIFLETSRFLVKLNWRLNWISPNWWSKGNP